MGGRIVQDGGTRCLKDRRAEGGRSWGPRGDVRTSEAERMRMWTECGQGQAHGSRRHRTVALATHFLLTGNFCRESLSFLDLVSSGKPRW